MGQFGFKTKVDELDLTTLRIIQLGWAIGSTASTPTVYGELIMPEGFTISQAATEKHNISQERAGNCGKSIREVLPIMMDTILKNCKKGGRIVAHHIEFDGGLISQELARAGLEEYKEEWDEHDM